MSRKECERQYEQQQWERRAFSRCAAMGALLVLLLLVLSGRGDGQPDEAVGPELVRVRLWPVATVGAGPIRLGEVAEVSLSTGGWARLRAVEGLVVGPAPRPGQTVAVSLEDVRKVLAGAGYNVANVLVGGSVLCRVGRPGEAATESGEAGDGRAGEEQESATLEQRLRQWIVRRLGKLGGQVEIRFSRPARTALGLSEPTYQFRIRRRGGKSLGLVSFEVDLLEGGDVVQTLPVVAEVTAVVPVVVARRAINRGATITAGDVMLQSRRFERLERIGLTDLAGAVGQQASRFIARGEMVGLRDIRPVPLVRRGDVVTVRLRRGGFLLEGAGKAVQSGCYGQTVEVRGPGSKESFYATVTGLRTVEVGGRRVAMASEGVGRCR